MDLSVPWIVQTIWDSEPRSANHSTDGQIGVVDMYMSELSKTRSGCFPSSTSLVFLSGQLPDSRLQRSKPSNSPAELVYGVSGK